MYQKSKNFKLSNMKNIYLKAGKAQVVFNDLKENFSGTLIANNDEYNLAFASASAKGNIKGISFTDGMTYMQFEMTFHDDARISMESLDNSPIFFAYCTQGKLWHSFGEHGDRKIIKKQQTGILKSDFRVNSILHFEKHIPVKFYVISIGTNNVDEHNTELVKKLKKVFFRIKKNYLHISTQNEKIAEKIENLNALPHKGVIRNLFMNRLFESILELEIKQHIDGLSAIAERVNSFALKQIDEINKASSFVVNLCQEVFTTDFIAQKFWFFANKMQKEFRLLFTRSIHDFLIYIRIERGRI